MPSKRSLDGRRVLVTRPAHQAEGLCRRIAQAGGVALRLPTLEIDDCSHDPAVSEVLARLTDYDLLIFVSPNAVRIGLRAIEAAAGLPPALPLATVGEGSARALQEVLGRGPDRLPETRYDSEGLLALEALQQMAGQRVLILRGDGGRTLLAETLRQRGAVVDYLELYRRVQAPTPPNIDQLLQQAEVVTTTSGEVLDKLHQLTPERWRALLREKPLLVVSPRSEALARQLGFVGPIRLAEHAGDEAMISALSDWSNQGFKP